MPDKKVTNKEMFCTNCHTVDKPKFDSSFIGFLLFLVLVPGTLIAVFVAWPFAILGLVLLLILKHLTKTLPQCPHCNSKDVVPMDSPRAQAFFAQNKSV